jgi:hypothetical protein
MNHNALAACFLVLGCAQSVAQPTNPLEDRFSVSLGTFLLDTGTTVRLDGDVSTGTEIDVERDLGFEEEDSFRADAYWRFAPRHKVRLLGFGTSRGASRTIQREIDFGDSTYPVDAEISSRFETQVIELAYEYAFMRRDTYELAGTIGLHQLSFELGLTGTQQGGTVATTRQADVSGPLPVVGFRGIWRLGERWHLDAQAQFFQLSFEEYDGRLEDYNIAVVWMPFDHFGIGAGYNDFVTRLDIDGQEFDGRLRWKYGGPRIFVSFSF